MSGAVRAALAALLFAVPLGCTETVVDGDEPPPRPGASSPSPSPSPAPSMAPVKARVSGTGGVGLRVRQEPTTASAQIGLLEEGQIVAIECRATGETIDGNASWSYLPEEGGFASDAFLTLLPGEPTPPPCEAGGDPEPGPAVWVDIDGPPVQPHVQSFANAACREVGACQASTYEGHQPSADLALDFLTSEAYGELPTDGHVFGDRLADFALASMAQYRIHYVIYRQRINLGDGWEAMEDRGSITQNHYDHVHVSFDP